MLEHVHREAQLRSTFIAHHTGVSESSADRHRGGAALSDKPDTNLSYRYNIESDGHFTDKPIDRKRYLTAYGRGGVDIKDHEVVFDPQTNILTGTHSGKSRKDSQAEVEAIKMWRTVADHYDSTGKELNKSDVYAKLGWQNSGKGAEKFGNYYWHAINYGWVERRNGSPSGMSAKGPWLHRPGVTPPGQQRGD